MFQGIGWWLRFWLFTASAVLLLLLQHGALAAGPRVILLRGWFGVFSTGLDTIADQLKARGIEAEVAGHLNWSNEVTDILRNRSGGRSGPLVLVGHSQGANNVIDMARTKSVRLQGSDLPQNFRLHSGAFVRADVRNSIVRPPG